MKKYCVYMHINKINNKRYVGITFREPEQRWQKGYGYHRQPKFYNAILKYGWDNFEHIILEQDIPTEEEALKLETFYIKKYDTVNNGYNTVEEGQCSSPFCFKGIPIYCIETNKYYNSIADAARDLNLKNPGDIEKVIRGERNGCHNLHFIKQSDINSENIKTILAKQTGRFRKIYCLDNQQIFLSLQDAAKFCGRSAQSVMLNCQNKRKSCGGYHFKYLTDVENFQDIYLNFLKHERQSVEGE